MGSAPRIREPRCRANRWWRIVATVLGLSLSAAAPAPAMRIVSLTPSITETLFALGVGDQVVGVSSYCDWPPEVAGIDRVGTFLAPNLEVILAKRPDLVIAVPSPGNRDSVQSMERVGLHVLVVDPETLAQTLASIRQVAAAVGRRQKGDDLVAAIEADMRSTDARLEGAPVRRVLMVIGQSPLVAVGAGVFQDELIRRAHGTNLAAAARQPWPHLSMEFVLEQAPEVIIDTSMGTDEQPAKDAATGFWQAFPDLPAVRAKHIFGYREYVLLRPGPRVAEAFRTMARFVHPERFEAQP